MSCVCQNKVREWNLHNRVNQVQRDNGKTHNDVLPCIAFAFVQEESVLEEITCDGPVCLHIDKEFGPWFGGKVESKGVHGANMDGCILVETRQNAVQRRRRSGGRGGGGGCSKPVAHTKAQERMGCGVPGLASKKGRSRLQDGRVRRHSGCGETTYHVSKASIPTSFDSCATRNLATQRAPETAFFLFRIQTETGTAQSTNICVAPGRHLCEVLFRCQCIEQNLALRRGASCSDIHAQGLCQR